jgi:hypothetical protein
MQRRASVAPLAEAGRMFAMSEPRWISVLDKWPHDEEWVLVSRLGGRLVCEAQHKGKGTFMRGASEVHPTHWMHLPEPPNDATSDSSTSTR